MKTKGVCENERNAANAALYKSIIREVYGVTDVIVGHHIVFVIEGVKEDGSLFQRVQELASADTLLFDHEVAQKLWGDDFKNVLTRLASEPVETRDTLLQELYDARDGSFTRC